MTRFVVERRLPRVSRADRAMLQDALIFACDRLTSRGEPVRCLGSAYLPDQARLLTWFEAESGDDELENRMRQSGLERDARLARRRLVGGDEPHSRPSGLRFAFSALIGKQGDARLPQPELGSGYVAQGVL